MNLQPYNIGGQIAPQQAFYASSYIPILPRSTPSTYSVQTNPIPVPQPYFSASYPTQQGYVNNQTFRVQNISRCVIPGCPCLPPNTNPNFYQNAVMPSAPVKASWPINPAMKLNVPLAFSFLDPQSDTPWGSNADQRILEKVRELVHLTPTGLAFSERAEVQKTQVAEVASIEIPADVAESFLQLGSVSPQSKKTKDTQRRSAKSHPTAVTKIKKPIYKTTRTTTQLKDFDVPTNLKKSTSMENSLPASSDFDKDTVIESGLVTPAKIG